MRLIVWLILLNVALLGYSYKDQILKQAPAIQHTTLNPEKLKLLLDTDFSSLDKKPDMAMPLNHCYKWGRFTSANLAAAQEVMARLGIESALVEDSPKQDRRFWVYYPPLPTLEKAQLKAEEIKKLGVDELFVVQDRQWRNAISFGLFSDERLADNLLKSLKAKGVKYALKSIRNQGDATMSLLAKSVNNELALALYNIRPEFIGTDVTPVACP